MNYYLVKIWGNEDFDFICRQLIIVAKNEENAIKRITKKYGDILYFSVELEKLNSLQAAKDKLYKIYKF